MTLGELHVRAALHGPPFLRGQHAPHAVFLVVDKRPLKTLPTNRAASTDCFRLPFCLGREEQIHPAGQFVARGVLHPLVGLSVEENHAAALKNLQVSGTRNGLPTTHVRGCCKRSSTSGGM